MFSAGEPNHYVHLYCFYHLDPQVPEINNIFFMQLIKKKTTENTDDISTHVKLNKITDTRVGKKKKKNSSLLIMASKNVTQTIMQ